MGAATLKVALIGGSQNEPLYRSLSEFERSIGIAVKIGFKGNHPDLNRHLDEVYRAGTGDYDLISTHNKYIASQSWFLRPLQDYFTVEELSHFYPYMVELFRYQGQLLGIPRNFDERILFYRTDWFQQLGLHVPPQSWEQLRETCVEFRKAGRIGYVYTGRGSGLWGTFFETLVSNGGRLFDERLQPAFNSPEGQYSLQFLLDLHRDGLTPAETPDMGYDEVSAYFRSGRCAMVTDWPLNYSLYNDPATSNVVGRYSIDYMPAGTVRRAVSSGSHGYAIPTSAKNMQMSVKLLKFLTSAAVQVIDANLGHIPVRTALMTWQLRKAPPGSLEQRRWWILIETLNRYVIGPPKFPEFPLAEQILTECLHQAVLGRLTAAEALSFADARISRIMAKYR